MLRADSKVGDEVSMPRVQIVFVVLSFIKKMSFFPPFVLKIRSENNATFVR